MQAMARRTVRIYTNFKQRYKSKNTFSKKLFDEIYKNFKKKSINLSNRFYKKQMKNKFYGKPWAPYVDDSKNIVALWKSNKDENWRTRTTKKFYKNLKKISKSQLCKIFNWKKDKKIATIFLPFLIDGNYQYGRQNLYLDNYTWITHTTDIIKKLKNTNWIIKEHPSESRLNSKINLSLILKELEKKYDHIRLFPEDIDPISLIKFTNVAITHHSTAGVEYPSFGIPCIVTENSFYTNCGFSIKPKNISEYKKLLKNVPKIGRLEKRKMDRAKVLLFILNILTKNVFSLMPEYIPTFETHMKKIDEKKFWYRANQKLKKFNLNNDHFKKMFEKQLHFNNRHTINFDICSIKNKVLNDY